MDSRRREPIALPFYGLGRPQIIIIGNGLERKDDNGLDSPDCLADAGKSWNDLVKSLTVPNHIELMKDDLKSIPFPLKYHLFSSDKDADYPLKSDNRNQERETLATAVQELGTVSNPALRRLPELCADHIFTTNYTYSLERAFYPNKNMLNASTRSQLRFNYNPEYTEKNTQRRERDYRRYTGYLGKKQRRIAGQPMAHSRRMHRSWKHHFGSRRIWPVAESYRSCMRGLAQIPGAEREKALCVFFLAGVVPIRRCVHHWPGACNIRI